jgi:hypothetical protein
MDKCDRCKKRPANMGTYSPTGLLLSRAGFSTDMKLCSKCVKELKTVDFIMALAVLQ